MNNKGLTLVEMVATVIVLGIVCAIPFVVMSKKIEESKRDAYKEQRALYERKAREWVTLNGKKDDESFHITLRELVDEKLLDRSKLTNPVDKSNFLDKGACVFVEYIEESKTFTYTFSETCVK